MSRATRPSSSSRPAIRIHGQVARDLGIAIVGGRWLPGAILPGEIVFSGQLSISRTAFREAIRILAAKGLVESRPKTGTRVLPRDRWALLDPDVLAWSFETEPSRAFVQDLFELRSVVEPAAAALAATRRTAEHLAAMEAALDGMARHTLATEAGRAADLAFHHAILEATGNEMLMSLSSSIGAAVGWTTVFKQRRKALPSDPVADHRALFDAIAAADADAARLAMTGLVDRALRATEMSLEA